MITTEGTKTMTTAREFLDTTGPLAKLIDGYESRPGQLAMTEAVEQAITRGETLVIEAPTGTGKSAAYLTPALLAAKASEAVTVVATANIALQEQLIGKDLPSLAAAGLDVPFALAKGINNYLCPARLAEAKSEDDLRFDEGEAEQWAEILAWAETTETGDVSELPFEIAARVRMWMTTSSDDCTGKACPMAIGCPARGARASWKDAKVIVTNYHLLFADLAVRQATDNAVGILPAYQILVCDEAHKAADIARDFFGARATLGSVRWASRLLAPRGVSKTPIPRIDEKLQGEIDSEARRFFDRLGSLDRRSTFRLTRPGSIGGSHLADLLARASTLYRRTAETADNQRAAMLKSAANRADTLRGLIVAADALDDLDSVYYVERSQRGAISLHSKPLSVAGTLSELLFDREQASDLRAAIVTSATLCDGKKTFGHCHRELGTAGAREMTVESPFDWSQCLLVCPEGTPDPAKRGPAYSDAVERMLVETIRHAEGRTLALFTSYRMLDRCYKRLTNGARLPYRILRQGDAPRTELVRQFKEDTRSVLLGTESFWAGVDCPGEALSCVFIDRLPFATPDDPIIATVAERDPKAWFPDWSLPRAVIQFRQGFGRLIRRQGDRGAVVVADPRIIEKFYGPKRFLSTLPKGVDMSRDLSDVHAFLGGAA